MIADNEAERYRTHIEELANAEALKTITLALHSIFQRMLQGPITLIAKALTGFAWALNKINDLMGKWLPLGAATLSWDNATVKACGNATVEAGGNATVEAWDNATVKAGGNAFISSWKNIECKLSDHAIFRNTETREITINAGAYTIREIEKP